MCYQSSIPAPVAAPVCNPTPQAVSLFRQVKDSIVAGCTVMR